MFNYFIVNQNTVSLLVYWSTVNVNLITFIIKILCHDALFVYLFFLTFLPPFFLFVTKKLCLKFAVGIISKKCYTSEEWFPWKQVRVAEATVKFYVIDAKQAVLNLTLNYVDKWIQVSNARLAFDKWPQIKQIFSQVMLMAIISRYIVLELSYYLEYST